MLLLLLLVGSFASCISKKKIVEARQEYIIFQKGLDSITKIQSAPELRCTPLTSVEILVGTSSLQKDQLDIFDNGRPAVYQLDSLGRINYPIIGKISFNNLTLDEAAEVLKAQLKKYIKDPYVRINQRSFIVTVFGEVQKPGNIEMVSQNPNIMEALSLARFSNIASKREGIVLLRQNKDSLQKFYLDLRDAQSILTSEAYFVKPNDIIVVAPSNRAIKQYISGGIADDNVAIQRLNIIFGIAGFAISTIIFLNTIR